MAKIENQFIGMNDDTLATTMKEYEEWCDTGFIPQGGPLAKARDKYCDAYDVHGLLIMEKELLYAGTKRWLETKEKGMK